MPIPPDIAERVERRLTDAELNARLAAIDMDEADPVLRAELAAIDPGVTLVSSGEKPRGMLREIELTWSYAGEERRQVLVLQPTGP